MVAAYHLHEDMMRGSVPVYWDESDRVAFDVRTGVSKSRRALDRREDLDRKKDSAQNYGKYYYVVPRTVDGGPLPTRDEWLEERRMKEGRQGGPPQPRSSPLLGLDGKPIQN